MNGWLMSGVEVMMKDSEWSNRDLHWKHLYENRQFHRQNLSEYFISNANKPSDSIRLLKEESQSQKGRNFPLENVYISSHAFARGCFGGVRASSFQAFAFPEW